MVHQGLRVRDGIAQTMAAQAGDPEWPVWVLEEDNVPLGCTTLFYDLPEWAFTEGERREPSLFLASTWTRPTRGRRLGAHIAEWALDHAARIGRRHVRRGCFHERLAHYYGDVQGWTLLRTLQRRGRTAYIMSRRAELQPVLPVASV